MRTQQTVVGIRCHGPPSYLTGTTGLTTSAFTVDEKNGPLLINYRSQVLSRQRFTNHVVQKHRHCHMHTAREDSRHILKVLPHRVDVPGDPMVEHPVMEVEPA